jgi:pyridoxamine 5'-phosphate oxidase
VIPDRSYLEEKVDEFREKLSDEPAARPAYWGGYVLKPIRIEFWQGRSNRLHDRILYSLQADGSWRIERLAP